MKARTEKKKHCQSCNAKFGLTTHKHMCKRCHAIICSECTKQKIQIVQYGDKKPHKICLNCSDDYQHNTNLKVTGKLQWAADSNIMKQWLKNINTTDKDKLQKQYEDTLQTTSPLVQSQEFQEYVKNIEQQINSGNSMKHFNSSFLEIVHNVWGQEPDIQKIRQQIINVIKAFFIDFPDQESPLTFKQEYVDFAVFLLLFGQESSVWRMMKEIYGIIIPIESISHITNNDFNYGEKYLMNFLLDKINYDFNSQECNSIYRFIQDRGIEMINSFFANQANFQTSYQIFNNVINIPYNRRWSELLRSLGVFIIENKDVIVQYYEKVVWDEMKLELNINTKWKRMKEKMDVYLYFQVADNRQMNRFSMVDDFVQSEIDSLLPSTEDIIEENKMLKKEVFQIFKVKQLITQKMDELDEMRMELQKRELIRQKYEENLKKFNDIQQKYNEMRQSYQELQQDNQFLQEKLMRFSTHVDHQNYITYEDPKRAASLIHFSENQQKQKFNLHEDDFLNNILKEKEKVNSTVYQYCEEIQKENDHTIVQIKQTSSLIEDSQTKDGLENSQVKQRKESSNVNSSNQEHKEIIDNTEKKQESEQINTLKKEIEDLENKNKYYLSQFKAQGDQILKQKLDLSKKENEIENLKSDLSKEKGMHAQTKQSYEKQIQEKKTEYEQIINKLKDENKIKQLEEKYQQEVTHLKERIDQLNLYNQILQQEKTELFLSKQNLFQQVNSLSSQISIQQGGNQEISQNKPEIDVLRNTITKLELEISSLKDDNSQLEKKLTVSQEKEQVINTLQQQVKNLQQEIKDSTSSNKQQNKLSDSIAHSELSTTESTNKSPTLNFVKNEAKQEENE